MPYRKRSYRRKRYVPRYKQIKQIVNKQIRSNAESKFHTTEYEASDIQDHGRTPLTADLCHVATGTSQNTRIGNQIIMTGMRLDGVIVAADATNIVRVVVYMPKDHTTALTGVSVTDFIDIDKYTVFMDKMIVVGTGGSGIKKFTFHRRWTSKGRKGIQVQFYGTTSTDFAKNRLKFYAVSDSLAVSDPKLSLHSRVYYKDT